jgi:hypothetical protein
MDDVAFELLKIKAAVCPQAESWPRPDIRLEMGGDKPTLSGELWWDFLHTAVNDAREHVSKAFARIAVVDADKALSDVGKAEKKKKIVEAALVGLSKSKSLDRARTAIERQVAKWDRELGLAPEPSTTISDAMIAAETRAYLAALKPAERMAFIDNHVAEAGAAVLTAPPFLSGLTPAELAVVKRLIEARTNPEVAASKAAILKAMGQTEAGWRNAAAQIAERGGLEKGHDGIESARAAAAADAA